MKRSILFVLSFILLFSTNLFSASDATSHDITLQVLEIVLIDMNSTSLITLTTNPPANGGEDPIGDTDNSKLLQYTSLVASGVSRNITASMTGSAPSGTSLSAEATNIPAGCGTAAGQITLSSTASNIITGISSCATGINTNGAEITYSFNIDDLTLLVVGDSSTVTVTYTLTDAS